MKLFVMIVYSLLSIASASARVDRSVCIPGETYKQSKTLDFYSHKSKKEIREVVSNKSPIIMKVMNNKGWGCQVKLFKESKSGLIPYRQGELFTVSYRYFDLGTVGTIVQQVAHLPEVIDEVLTPKVEPCKTKPKESKVEVETAQKEQSVKQPKIDPIQQMLEKYEQSSAVHKMVDALENRCSKYCCYNNCKSQLPYRSWCKSRFARQWDLGEKTKQCRDSLGRCYGYAKLGLMAGGFLDQYMADNNMNYPWTYSPHAKKAGVLLKKSGFINVLEDRRFKGKKITPYNCPKGAVLVYSAPGGQSGHIEIVDVDEKGNRKYYSDFMGTKPIYDNPRFPSLNKNNRPLIGIYIKEMEVSNE